MIQGVKLEGTEKLQLKLTRFVSSLDRIASDVATRSVGDVAEAVRGDIGDTSMSGWSRKNPTPIVGMVERGRELAIAPTVKARGPMRVLESGRNTYSEGQRRNAGSYISKKTGVRKQKTRIVGRGGLGTAGKSTWSDAEQLIKARLPLRAKVSLLSTMGGIFSKG